MAKKDKKKKKLDPDGKHVVATNRRARFEYEIVDTFEAGIVLVGPEVKSLRDARANLGDAYASIHRGELWLEKLHISPYEAATRANPSDPQRRRKLLVHRYEIDRLDGSVAEKGLTLIPLSIYFLGWSREGRDGARTRQASARQARDDQASRRRP